ncbi:MAG: VOC family protein [Mediterraneibacter sp.]
MRLKNVLITVKDMEKSKAFYKELFGLDVILDNDGNVILTEGLVLQDAGIWEETVGGGIIPRNNASELYFEETDIESFAGKLDAYPEEIQYINRLTQDSQGRKVIRFYDPDGNLIEVGQNRKTGSFQ